MKILDKITEYLDKVTESSEVFKNEMAWQARAKSKGQGKVFFRKRENINTAINKLNRHSIGYWDDDANKGYIYESSKLEKKTEEEMKTAGWSEEDIKDRLEDQRVRPWLYESVQKLDKEKINTVIDKIKFILKKYNLKAKVKWNSGKQRFDVSTKEELENPINVEDGFKKIKDKFGVEINFEY